MPIYEYRCDSCRKRSSALLPSFSSPDPNCPGCGRADLRRTISTFATVRSDGSRNSGDFGEMGDSDDFGDMGEDAYDGGDHFGGDDDAF